MFDISSPATCFYKDPFHHLGVLIVPRYGIPVLYWSVSIPM